MAVNEKEITFESDLEFDTSCSESDDGMQPEANISNISIKIIQSEQKRKVGIIQNFFKIQNSIYCVISKLEKYKNIIELKENTKSVIDNLERFFIICKRSVNFDLIKIEDIVSKCVLLQHNEEYFVSIFNETDEIID
jgi:hypothetical protein